MRRPRDPELDGMFEEPELRDLAQLLRAAAPRGADPDAAFRTQLRRRLLEEAWQRAARPAPWYRRLFAAPTLAWAGAAVGLLLIGVAALTFQMTHSGQTTQLAIGSPEQGAQEVALVEPIALSFSQPMDRDSVQRSIDIQPATQVHYDWQGNTLKITPVNGGLAPSTHYQVMVAPSARTAAGQGVGALPAVSFVTAPAPSPKPTPTPTPTPVRLPGVRTVAPASSSRWAADGTALHVVGPAGQLQTFPIGGGEPRTLAPDGVNLIAIGGDDAVAYQRGHDIIANQLTVKDASAAALGLRGGRPVFLSGRDVLAADRSRLATLPEDARSAQFSAAGDRLAWLGASGLHVTDLATGRDAAQGPAAVLGDWSADGKRFAYATDASVLVTDGGASPPAKVLDLGAVNGIAWSHSDRLLLTSGAGLALVGTDGSGLRRLDDQAGFSDPAWSPAGGQISFRRDGSVSVAALTAASPTAATSFAGQDALVGAFMDARRSGSADQAAAFLDAAGRDAYARTRLTFSDQPALSRYYVLLSEPGRVVVRLVFKDESTIEETMGFQRDPAGRLLIHGAAATPVRPLSRGPEVIEVRISGNQVRVAFDSDLDPATLAAGIGLRGLAAAPAYDPASRTVTLTVPAGLAPGTDYTLYAGSVLRDVGRRAQPADYELHLLGPAAG